ncbi:MAG: hypothetical protein JNK82_29275 [Myxococcaceae bacterium]|nr:hypothetical protein [Myxococcaceae bacterium]
MRRLLVTLLLFTACGPAAPQKTCTPTSCTGCCTDDDRCVVEVRERDTYCGFNGSACVNCVSTGKTCSTVTLACQ